MPEPTTPNKGFTIPNTGDLVNAWGPVLNANFSLMDALLGTSATIALTAGSVTVTTPQTQVFQLLLTGTLTGAVTLTIPAKAGIYTFRDTTARGSSVYPITVTTGTGRTQNLPTRMSQVYCDSQNVYLMNEPDLGDMKPSAGTAPPPLWMACTGQAVSRTTYADLYTAIGTQFGSGDGSTTFNLPDARGRTVFSPDVVYGSAAAGRLSSASGFGSTAVGTAGGSELLSAHTHAITDPGHTHTVNDPGHTHTQNAHNHAVTDPGHVHTDGGHVHTVGFTTTTLQSGSSSIGVSGSTITENTSTGYAQIQTATTGVSVNNATATNQTNTTGITNATATTGITINSEGGGSSANMPPAILVPWIIYAGQ